MMSSGWWFHGARKFRTQLGTSIAQFTRVGGDGLTIGRSTVALADIRFGVW